MRPGWALEGFFTMLLKRVYGSSGEVAGVQIKHTGASPEQTWSASKVEQYMSEGWMAMRGDEIVITAEDGEELVYDILRRPGYYCASTGERIPLSEPAMSQFMNSTAATLAPAEARAWLTAKGLPPTGYEATRNYHCRLDSSLHAAYCAVVGPKGQIVAACRLEG